MKNGRLIFLALLLLLFVGVVLLVGGAKGHSTPSANVVSSPGSSLISSEELAKHNSGGDCWVAYNGKAYDITAFLPNHPGSAGAIIPDCGTAKEFQDAFTNKHGTTKASLLMKVGVFMGDFKIKGAI